MKLSPEEAIRIGEWIRRQIEDHGTGGDDTLPGPVKEFLFDAYSQMLARAGQGQTETAKCTCEKSANGGYRRMDGCPVHRRRHVVTIPLEEK